MLKREFTDVCRIVSTDFNCYNYYGYAITPSQMKLKIPIYEWCIEMYDL